MSPQSHEGCPYTGTDRRGQNNHDVRIALLEQGMDSIKQQLKGINGNMSKLVWLIFTSLILAILKVVLIQS